MAEGSSRPHPPPPSLQLIIGIVTEISESFGIIDGDVIFRFNKVIGELPSLGDRVLLETVPVTGISQIKWNAERVQLISKEFTPTRPPPPQKSPSSSHGLAPDQITKDPTSQFGTNLTSALLQNGPRASANYSNSSLSTPSLIPRDTQRAAIQHRLANFVELPPIPPPLPLDFSEGSRKLQEIDEERKILATQKLALRQELVSCCREKIGNQTEQGLDKPSSSSEKKTDNPIPTCEEQQHPSPELDPIERKLRNKAKKMAWKLQFRAENAQRVADGLPPLKRPHSRGLGWKLRGAQRKKLGLPVGPTTFTKKTSS